MWQAEIHTLRAKGPAALRGQAEATHCEYVPLHFQTELTRREWGVDYVTLEWTPQRASRGLQLVSTPCRVCAQAVPEKGDRDPYGVKESLRQ